MEGRQLSQRRRSGVCQLLLMMSQAVCRCVSHGLAVQACMLHCTPSHATSMQFLSCVLLAYTVLALELLLSHMRTCSADEYNWHQGEAKQLQQGMHVQLLADVYLMISNRITDKQTSEPT
jgi:hypothetical protein